MRRGFGPHSSLPPLPPARASFGSGPGRQRLGACTAHPLGAGLPGSREDARLGSECFFFFSGKACSTQTPQERRLSGCTSQMLTAGKWGQGSLKYEKWELGMRGNENWAPTPAAAWRGAACQHPRKQLTSLNPHFLIRAMRWQPHPHSPPPPPLRVESCAKPWGSPGPPGKLSSCRKLQPRGHFPTTAQQVARRRDSLETVP